MDSTGIEPDVLARGGLTLEVNGLVATITLDRPETKNSQTPSTWHALRIIGAELDPAVRVVVVRGAGDTFSSGLDRRMLSPEGIQGENAVMQLLDMPDGEMAESIATWQEGFTWLRRPERITIAAVHGAAVGAGFQLALACDLRVLTDTARFSMREPLLGLVPDLTGTKPLVELVGYSRALEICATTRWVGAEEARTIGLATAVVPAEELDDDGVRPGRRADRPDLRSGERDQGAAAERRPARPGGPAARRAGGAGAAVPGSRVTDGGLTSPDDTEVSRCRWDPAWDRSGDTCAPTAASRTRSSPGTRCDASWASRGRTRARSASSSP